MVYLGNVARRRNRGEAPRPPLLPNFSRPAFPSPLIPLMDIVPELLSWVRYATRNHFTNSPLARTHAPSMRSAVLSPEEKKRDFRLLQPASSSL